MLNKKVKITDWGGLYPSYRYGLEKVGIKYKGSASPKDSDKFGEDTVFDIIFHRFTSVLILAVRSLVTGEEILISADSTTLLVEEESAPHLSLTDTAYFLEGCKMSKGVIHQIFLQNDNAYYKVRIGERYETISHNQTFRSEEDLINALKTGVLKI